MCHRQNKPVGNVIAQNAKMQEKRGSMRKANSGKKCKKKLQNVARMADPHCGKTKMGSDIWKQGNNTQTGAKTSDNLPKTGAGMQPRGRGYGAQVWLSRWDQSGKKTDNRMGEVTRKELISFICWRIFSMAIGAALFKCSTAFFLFVCFTKLNVMKCDRGDGRDKEMRETEPFWCCLYTWPKCDPNMRNIRASWAFWV